MVPVLMRPPLFSILVPTHFSLTFYEAITSASSTQQVLYSHRDMSYVVLSQQSKCRTQDK